MICKTLHCKLKIKQHEPHKTLELYCLCEVFLFCIGPFNWYFTFNSILGYLMVLFCLWCLMPLSTIFHYVNCANFVFFQFTLIIFDCEMEYCLYLFVQKINTCLLIKPNSITIACTMAVLHI